MRPPRPFPEGSVERLAQALRGAQSKVEFQRVQCVWLRAALGLNANQVAQALGDGGPPRYGGCRRSSCSRGKGSGSVRDGAADATRT